MTPAPAFLPSGFFVLRTALLPWDEFLRWSAGLQAAEAASRGESLTEPLAADRAKLRAALRELAAQGMIREALFLASPSLDEGLQQWLRDPSSSRGQKVERPLVRYLARMTGRATPFGLFAGCAVGHIGSQTRLHVEDAGSARRHTRLDMEYLFALTELLAKDPALRMELHYRPNSTLYRAAGRLRYAESRFDGQERSHHLVAVDDTDYLQATLQRAAQGASAAELAAALTSDEITLAEAQEYISELIDSQVLVPELGPPVTGPEPIHALIERLARHPAAGPITETLRQTRADLEAIDAQPLGVETARYRQIAARLEQLPAKVELSRLFQVDLVKGGGGGTLGPEVLAEIVRGIEILHSLSVRPARDPLAAFRDAFVERYGQREVPLAEVLDEEMGLGFDRSDSPDAESSPLLEGLAFAGGGQATVSWGSRQMLLLRKLSTALQDGATQIELSEEDLQQLATADPLPLPDALAAVATVAARSADELRRGNFRLLLGAGGPSGARLLGRFCHADPELARAVADHLRAEESLVPGAVFAEIVHLPEGRIGNVLLRPVLRDYEIPYLGQSGAPPAQQIPLDDLLVSVAGGRVRLRSRRLNCEVHPRLTTAHNFAWKSLGLYKFLCQLQGQGRAPWLSWSWGPLESAPFLPRVTAGRLILSRAKWTLGPDELRELNKTPEADWFAGVYALRRRRKLPRYVALADGDNELPLDLDNVLCVETLVDLVKNRPEAVLVELVPGPDEQPACGPAGRYVHEMVVPLVKWPAPAEPGQAPGASATQRGEEEPRGTPVRRLLPPGSEWLYLKLYTGASTADQLLREFVRPLTRHAMELGAADHWFFIRYGDPQWHLRIRLHGQPRQVWSQLLPLVDELAEPGIAMGQTWRIETGAYDREIERYGGEEGMLLAERLFHVDSEAALDIIECCPGDAGLDARWRLALRGIETLLADLGLDGSARLAVLRRARDGFAAEFRAESGVQHQLSKKYRAQRQNVEQILDPQQDADSPLAPGLEVLRERSLRMAPWVEALRGAEAGGRLTAPLAELALSYMHMFVNRVLRSAHRAQELVLYDFLVRYHESRQARARQA